MPQADWGPACMYNIPIALDPLVSQSNGLDPDFAKGRNSDHVLDLKARTIGPMPMDEFLDYFLPIRFEVDETQRLSSSHAFNRVPPSAESPEGIYRPLLEALNRRTAHKARCPGFVFDVAATRSPLPHRPGYMKPHLCCYTADNVDTVQQSPYSSRVEFGFAELFIEVKPDPTHDFFTNPPVADDATADQAHDMMSLLNDEDPAATSRFGQHISFVAEIFARQFRAFFFTISMSGSRARILRWERAGCVVTESFDIREHPEILCEFLWRFSQVTHAERGHDATVEIASAEEEEDFRNIVTSYVRSQLGVDNEDLDQAVEVHYQPGRVFAVLLLPQHFSTHPENIRRFIVSRPVVTPLSLIGRGTRGYWALDTSSRRIVFLKDTWRSLSSEELEGDTLRRLNDLGVRHVPGLVWHGDVPYYFPDETRKMRERELQCTTTHHVSGESWIQHGDKEFCVLELQHYRLVTGPVGYPLKSVRGAKELLHATYDVFCSMRDALAKDSRIHRDLSVGNIILVQEGKDIRTGYLIDWDTSCRVDESGEAVDPGRVGTWAFISIRMLESVDVDNPRKHTFKDDMESLLYVILYCALLWQPHNLTPSQLTNIISYMFDLMQIVLSLVLGGGGKIVNRVVRGYTQLLKLESASLGEWLTTVMNFHSPRSEDDVGKWSAEHLDTYWRSFLQTHSLEENNRFVHTLDMSKLKDPITEDRPQHRVSAWDSTSESESGSSSTSHHTTPLQHTPPTTLSDGESREVKRPRRSWPSDPKVSIAPAPPVRRSERIRDKKSAPKQAATTSKKTSKATGRRRRRKCSASRKTPMGPS